MNRPRWIFALVIALVIAFAVALRWRAAITAGTVPTPAPATLEPALTTPAAAVVAGAVEPSSLPASTPAATVVASLRGAADAGDARAACRVAITLLACRDAALHVEAIAQRNREPDADAVPDPTENEETRRAIEDIELRSAALYESCQAIPADVRARSGDYLTMAAHAGQTEAMIRYVDGHHLFTRTSMDFLANPGFETWRRDAPAMLQQLLQRGEPEAVFLLWIGHSASYGLLAGLIDDNPELALAYHDLMNRLGGGAAPRQTYGLDAAAQQRARERAAKWHREYFGNRSDLRDTITRRLTPDYWSDRGDHRMPCTD